MTKSLTIIVLTTLLSCSKSEFNADISRIISAIDCNKSKVIQGGSDYGALFWCVGGSVDTVKIFINEDRGRVKNIKFMWNDWTKNLGDGLHTDKDIAQDWLFKFMSIYAPGNFEAISDVFFSNKNVKAQSENYLIDFTYSKGPDIDERLYIITPKSR